MVTTSLPAYCEIPTASFPRRSAALSQAIRRNDMDYYLNISVTKHFTERLMADEYTDTAPMDTLIRLIWRSTGIPCKGDKAAYIQAYADREGIKPVDPVSYWERVKAEKKAKHG